MDYAIIRVGNKQHRVRDGETLVVDRVAAGEGDTFKPDVLLGDGEVTATVVAHERGPKIRIGKYRRRTGYRRHTGFRAATSRLEISFGGAKRKAAEKGEAAAPDESDRVKGMPTAYEEMTVAQISDGAKTWNRPMLEAALEYEQAHAARKGAIAAVESALKAKEESS
jgi:large subunit ribosomal protein L21